MSYRRHPLDIASLVFGLIFLGIVAAWGLFELDVVSGADSAWILPIVLIGAGALGVVLAATKERRTRQPAGNLYTGDTYSGDTDATPTDTTTTGTTTTETLETQERHDD